MQYHEKQFKILNPIFLSTDRLQKISAKNGQQMTEFHILFEIILCENQTG